MPRLRRTAFFTFACSTCLALLVITAGCSAPSPTTRVLFPGVMVNHQRGRFLLDTGSDSTILDGSGAARLGIKSQLVVSNLAVNGRVTERITLSEDVTLRAGGETFTTPLPIDTAPWMIRWLMSDDHDGLIGWPEIRGNILVFDPIHHLISGTDALPEETSQWTKLGVGDTDVFTLEVTTPDGSKGKVLVDTGDPMGVGLTTTQWRAWRSAHPKAKLTPRVYATPGVGIIERDEGWADEIDVGNLHFTDVPVYEVPPMLAAEFDNFAGDLGMYALERMDLVVDAKNHAAYAHPLPPPGPPYPGVKRPNAPAPSSSESAQGDWVVTGTVALKRDSFLVQTARYNIYASNFDAAITDCDHALELEPTNIDALLTRGAARGGKEDFDGAAVDLGRVIEIDPDNIAARSARAQLAMHRDDAGSAVKDFDRLVALEPLSDAAWSGRGEAREVLGDFEGALADFQKAAGVAVDDSNYFVLYAELLQLRLGQNAPDFAGTIGHWKRGWTKTLGKFVAGDVSESALLLASRKRGDEPADGQRCEAYFFIGFMHLLHGDKSGAGEYFKKCVDTGQKDYFEYQFAKGELKRLGIATEPQQAS